MSFLDDYREVNKYMYMESHSIKGSKKILFLNLPPVQASYPNERRVQQCKQMIEKRNNMTQYDSYRNDSSTFVVFGNSDHVKQLVGTGQLKALKKLEKKKSSWVEYCNVQESSLEKLRKLYPKSFEKKINLEDDDIEEDDDEDDDGLKAGRKIEMKEYVDMSSITFETKILQKYILKYLSQKRLNNLKKHKFRRKMAMIELLETEESYFKKLKVLDTVYYEEFLNLEKKKKSPINFQDISSIFSGIKAMIKLSEEIGKNLRSTIYKNNEYQHYSSISKYIIKIAPFLKSYQQWSSKYQKNLNKIEVWRKKSKGFKQTLDKMDSHPDAQNLGLSSYLILPIQRVLKYKLLLREIIRNTENEHPDFGGLSEAIVRIKETADHLNNQMKEIEESEKVLDISKNFNEHKNISIHLPHRRYISQCSVSQIIEDGYKKTKISKILYLFNDILIIAQRSRNNKLDLFDGIPLERLNVFESKESIYKKIMKVNKNYLFKFENVEEKNNWMALIVHFKKLLKKNTSGEKSTYVDLGESVSSNKKNNMEFIRSANRKGIDEINFDVKKAIERTKDVKQPTKMLKYCQTGGKYFAKFKKPHYRKFVISQDESRIQWWSKNKKMNESYIEFKDINELCVGQTTYAFKRNPKPLAEGLSFSILYGHGKYDIESNMWTGKTLDLICPSKLDFLNWTSAIRFILADRKGTAYTRNTAGKGAFDELSFKALQIDRESEKKKDKEKFAELGDLYSWGKGELGALGHEDQKDVLTPRVIAKMLLLDIKLVRVGKNCGVVILPNGSVLSWGEGEYGKLGHGNKVNVLKPKAIQGAVKKQTIIDASFGASHLLLLSKKGEVFACGLNVEGQCGQGKSKEVLSPKLVKFPGNVVIKKVRCGAKHSSAIDSEGKLFLWGDGSDGQLGFNDKIKYQTEPRMLETYRHVYVKDSALGQWHTLFLSKEGNVYGTGDNSSGQLGIGKDINKINEPKKIPFFKENVIGVQAGDYHSGCITKDGKMYLFGSGQFGQIGNGYKNKENYVPILVNNFIDGSGKKAEINRVVQLSLGSNHCIAIVSKKNSSGKKVLTWGGGMFGRLGVKGGSISDKASPMELTFFSEKRIRFVAAGTFSTMAICAHQWVPDEDVKICMGCDRVWTFSRRRHHCRYCGGIYCDDCSSNKIIILRFSYDKNVRVCDTCYGVLKKQQSL